MGVFQSTANKLRLNFNPFVGRGYRLGIEAAAIISGRIKRERRLNQSALRSFNTI